MKIAYIINSYPATAHTFIRREIRALEAQGHQVTRLAMRPDKSPLVDPQDLEEVEVTRYVLGAGPGALARSTLVRAATRPARFVRALRLAVSCGARIGSASGVLRHLVYLAEAAYVADQCAEVGAEHAHAHFGTNAATVAMLSHELGGPEYSFTVHGPEEFDAPRALSLPEKIVRSKFTVAITSYGRSQLSRWVAPEHWNRIEVVHCGIEPDHYPEPTPLPTGSLRLVTIGRLAEQKGQLMALDALVVLKDAGVPVHLTLIGDGEMRPEVEEGIAARGLGDDVTLTGWVGEARILAELESSQALLLPSFAEGLPMVIMETMAAGRLVVATYIAGIPELVQPGETGWLVPAGDAEALAEALLDVSATSQEDRQRMADNARRRVVERHDVANEAHKLSEFITATRSLPAH